jgi:hypothetical protein
VGVRRSSVWPGLADGAETLEGSALVSDPEAARKEWARRAIEAYDGWPQWLTPGETPHALPWVPGGIENAGDAGRTTAADEPSSHTSSGWSWGMTQAELEEVDRRLRLTQRRGETARAIRAERTYWGFESEDD